MSTLASPFIADAVVRTRMMNMAAGAVVLYDHLCSLDKEVDYVWRRRPWNLGSFMFLLNRYLPYAYISMALEENWLITSSPAACQGRDIGNAIILSLRTWAVWERKPIVKWIILIYTPLNLAAISVCFFFMFRTSPCESDRIDCYCLANGTTTIEDISISAEKLSCFSVIIEVLIARSVPNLEMAGLTLVKAIGGVFTQGILKKSRIYKPLIARHCNSKWVFKIHYRGILYYMYILILSAINVSVTIRLRNIGLQSFSVIQATLHSVLSNRVVFLAREPSELEASLETTMYDDSFRCA
ncbi:hypothetical protein NP233_g7490 [Leucocoprinus birnbaumii]|uniref:DUF6533 domain-containing protein n=1 Tax=Leucocoprinus birnbaumii TaxID=56174 RepID=A0AAD5VP80_9AGAR|nr:hypothetical protein NP233_g7490 [Leucocoprinus birnbaumii]